MKSSGGILSQLENPNRVTYKSMSFTDFLGIMGEFVKNRAEIVYGSFGDYPEKSDSAFRKYITNPNLLFTLDFSSEAEKIEGYNRMALRCDKLGINLHDC